MNKSFFSLENPAYREVFLETLADLSLEAESFEIALAALKLQTLLKETLKD